MSGPLITHRTVTSCDIYWNSEGLEWYEDGKCVAVPCMPAGVLELALMCV